MFGRWVGCFAVLVVVGMAPMVRAEEGLWSGKEPRGWTRTVALFGLGDHFPDDPVMAYTFVNLVKEQAPESLYAEMATRRVRRLYADRARIYFSGGCVPASWAETEPSPLNAAFGPCPLPPAFDLGWERALAVVDGAECAVAYRDVLADVEELRKPSWPANDAGLDLELSALSVSDLPSKPRSCRETAEAKKLFDLAESYRRARRRDEALLVHLLLCSRHPATSWGAKALARAQIELQFVQPMRSFGRSFWADEPYRRNSLPQWGSLVARLNDSNPAIVFLELGLVFISNDPEQQRKGFLAALQETTKEARDDLAPFREAITFEAPRPPSAALDDSADKWLQILTFEVLRRKEWANRANSEGFGIGCCSHF